MVLFISICHLEWNFNTVWFNFSKIKELLIDIFPVISMWATKIITLSHCALVFNCINSSQSHIIYERRLYFTSIHSSNYKIHSIKHFHLHTPFRGNCLIWFKWIKHIRWSQNCYFRVDFLHFLLSDPFCSQSHTLRIWISTSS